MSTSEGSPRPTRNKIERGWFGVDGAAAYMGIGVGTVIKAAKSGRLKGRKGPGADLQPCKTLKTCRKWCDEFIESYPEYSDYKGVMA